MGVELIGLHWVYVLFMAVIIGFMIARKDTTIVCIMGIFVLGLMAAGSLSHAVIGVFSSFIYAIKELLGTILVISIIVGMSSALAKTGINETMIAPVTRLIRTPTLAFWVTGIVMMIISWFFWPSPAVALIGAVLLPVAVRAGLPALGVAMAMNLFGHGIALSGDYVIQGAPKLTADAAGIPVGDGMSASVPLVIVVGLVTTVTAYIFLRNDMKTGKLTATQPQPHNTTGMSSDLPFWIPTKSQTLTRGAKRLIAVAILLLFALDVLCMFVFKLQGGDATALIGGTALFILLLVALIATEAMDLRKPLAT